MGNENKKIFEKKNNKSQYKKKSKYRRSMKIISGGMNINIVNNNKNVDEIPEFMFVYGTLRHDIHDHGGISGPFKNATKVEQEKTSVRGIKLLHDGATAESSNH